MDPQTTAFLYPGQGSQRVGMGKALAAAEPVVAETFEQADEILGYHLSHICWDGPKALLDDTEHTQPALLTHSVSILRLLQARLPGFHPAATAGHSLGEFSALVGAEAISFEDGLRLVRERGLLMKGAGESNPGSMIAILGLDLPMVEQACSTAEAQTGRVATVANDNCLGQIVISGDPEALSLAQDLLKDAGARKMVTLAVSIAAHSSLMQPAQAGLIQALQGTNMEDPKIPVFGNVEAKALLTAAEVRAELSAQLTSRVRWAESVRAMMDAGTRSFVEIGTGRVLTSLLRRIEGEAEALNVEHAEDLEAFIQ